MLTVLQLQDLVRYYARDESILLTGTTGLSILNTAYRRLVLETDAAEFRVKTRLAQTIDGQGTYVFNLTEVIDEGTSGTSPTGEMSEGDSGDTGTITIDGGDSSNPCTFTQIYSVEVENNATGNLKNIQVHAGSEYTWSDSGRDAKQIPVYWLRKDEAGVNKIEFRPAPEYNYGDIIVTFKDEPDLLALSTDTTRYLSKTMDDILARYVASEYLIRNGFLDAGTFQIETAKNILSTMAKEWQRL